MRSMVLAANAAPKVGGQGLNLHHMVEAYAPVFELSLFAKAAAKGVPTTIVPGSRLGGFIGRTPVLRRLRDWQGVLESSAFDQFVARSMPKADIFQGALGQCSQSLSAARAKGAVTVLDVTTTHIDDFYEHQVRECAKFGVRTPHNERIRNQILDEYRKADLIRVMSEHARTTFLRRGFDPGRVFVMPPPIEAAEFPQAEFRESTFRVSFVGLIEPWKGFHYLIDAFRSLNLPDSELVLWGSSGARPIAEYLNRQMAALPSLKVRGGSVRSIGYGEVYGKSSVLVHPSLTDGFGYVVAEAMASGIPVIVTRNTGAADAVIDGYNGYIVEAGDASALAERIRHLALNRHLLTEMGAAARKTALEMTIDRFRAPFLEHLKQRNVSCTT